MHLKMLSGKRRPFGLSLNVLRDRKRAQIWGGANISSSDLAIRLLRNKLRIFSGQQYMPGFMCTVHALLCVVVVRFQWFYHIHPGYHTSPAMGRLEQLERLHSEISPAAPWLPILVIHIRSHVKTRQSESYNFKKIAKNSNFVILQDTLHATHFLKLLDKLYQYEMDPSRTIGATEHSRDAGRTDRWTDGWTDRRTEWNQYTPPNNFVVWRV